MKQLAYILLLMTFFTTGSCTDIDKDNPYDNQLHTLQIGRAHV